MKKKSFRMIVIIFLLQIIVMSIVYAFVEISVSSNLRNNTIKSMETIVQERSKLIENYISETENYLTAYSRAGEITALLKNPTDEECLTNAQIYTENFSKDRDFVEGIYVAEWDTHVLAHTNAKVRGIYTRKGESLMSLQNALAREEGVFNMGILISPASKEQIISLYRTCFDENKNPIGFVGGGIYTQGILEMLDKLPSEGMKQLKYCMVNTESGEYIFHEDKEMLNQVAEDKYINDIIANIKTGDKNNFGYIIYENDGEKYLASYSYMQDKDWVFIITDPYSEVFATLNTVKKLLAVICVFGVVILTLVTNRAVTYLVKSIQKAVGVLSNCSGSINNNTNVLYKDSETLVGSVTENTATIEELSASLETTDDIMEEVKEKVAGINQWMEELLGDMKNSVVSSSELIVSSKSMAEQSKGAYSGSYATFEETKRVAEETTKRMENISEINKLADVILDIAKQTTLLSLNATLEAARAGMAGKGFAVVANQIGELARTTTSTASDISQMCEEINESVEGVKECLDGIIEFMEKTVMSQFGSFTDKFNEYSDSVATIQDNIIKLDRSSDVLRVSLNDITENIYAIKEITHENGLAIGTIAEKNIGTSKIADEIKDQSDSNKELVEKLEKIIEYFQS